MDDSDAPRIVSNLTITKVELGDNGNYTCNIATSALGDATTPTATKSRRYQVHAVVLPRVTAASTSVIKTKISQSVNLFCTFEAHPLDKYLSTIKWTHVTTNGPKDSFNSPAEPIATVLAANLTNIQKVDDKHVNVTLSIADVFKKDNGTYTCSMEAPFVGDDDDAYLSRHRKGSKDAVVLVLDAPQVSMDYVQAVGASKIFVNWTVNDGNEAVKQYFVQYQKEGAQTFTYYNHAIDGKNLSYVLENFEPNSVYRLKITAQNSIGSSPPYTYPTPIRTLDKDPVFIPEIGVKGWLDSSIIAV